MKDNNSRHQSGLEASGETSRAESVSAESVIFPDARVAAGEDYVIFTDASMQKKHTKATEDALSDSVFLGKSNFQLPFSAHRDILEEQINHPQMRSRGVSASGDDEAPGVSVSMMTWRKGRAYTTFVGDAPVWIAEIDPEHHVTMHRLNPVTHVRDPFQPKNRIELHNGGGEKQAYVARLLSAKNEPVNLSEYSDGDLSYDKLHFLPKEHVATEKNFEEAVARGSRFAVVAGTRGLVSSASDLREEAEGIVDRFLSGNPRVGGGVDEVEMYGEILTSRGKRGDLTAFEDVQERYQLLGSMSMVGSSSASIDQREEYARKKESFREHYVRRVGHALRSHDAERAAEDAYGAMLSYHLAQGGGLGDPLLAAKLNARALMQAENEGLDTKQRPDLGFIVAELDPDKERTVVVAEAGGPEAAPLVSNMKRAAGKRFELFESKGLKIPDSAAPLFQVKSPLERIDERSEGGSFNLSALGGAGAGTRSDSEREFSFHRTMPSEPTLIVPDFSAAAPDDLPGLQAPHSAEPAKRGGVESGVKRNGEITEEPFLPARQDEGPRDEKQYGRQTDRPLGVKKRLNFIQLVQRAVSIPLKYAVQFLGVKRGAKKGRDVESAESSAGASVSSLIYAPKDYGGDIRIASGTEQGVDYVALSDSGGKLHKFNQDRVSVGLSSFESPFYAHLKTISAAKEQALDIDGPKGKNGATTLTMLTWKKGKAFVTYLGDSPVWVMEKTKDNQVIPHLMNPEFHNPSPLHTHDVFHCINGDNERVGLRTFDFLSLSKNQKDVEVRLRERPININSDHIVDDVNKAYIRVVRDFSDDIRNGSQFFALTGSDGLLDHVNLTSDKMVEKVKNAFSSGLDSEGGERIRKRAIDLFMEKEPNLTGGGPPVYNKAKKACAKMMKSVGLLDERFRILYDDIFNKLLREEMERSVYSQYNKASNRYAKIFENHLLDGGKVSDPLLAARINDAATQMYVASREERGMKGNPDSVANHPARSKDNTAFSIAALDSDKEITTVVADGNGSFGDIIAKMVVEEANKKMNPFDISKLSFQDSAVNLYAGVGNCRKIDNINTIENERVLGKNRKESANRDLLIKFFFDKKGNGVQTRLDELEFVYERNNSKKKDAKDPEMVVENVVGNSRAMLGFESRYLMKKSSNDFDELAQNSRLDRKKGKEKSAEFVDKIEKYRNPTLAELSSLPETEDRKKVKDSAILSTPNSPGSSSGRVR